MAVVRALGIEGCRHAAARVIPTREHPDNAAEGPPRRHGLGGYRWLLACDLVDSDARGHVHRNRLAQRWSDGRDVSQQG